VAVASAPASGLSGLSGLVSTSRVTQASISKTAHFAGGITLRLASVCILTHIDSTAAYCVIRPFLKHTEEDIEKMRLGQRPCILSRCPSSHSGTHFAPHPAGLWEPG
jgi:hypothetical protein